MAPRNIPAIPRPLRFPPNPTSASAACLALYNATFRFPSPSRPRQPNSISIPPTQFIQRLAHLRFANRSVEVNILSKHNNGPAQSRARRRRAHAGRGGPRPGGGGGHGVGGDDGEERRRRRRRRRAVLGDRAPRQGDERAGVGGPADAGGAREHGPVLQRRRALPRRLRRVRRPGTHSIHCTTYQTYLSNVE